MNSREITIDRSPHNKCCICIPLELQEDIKERLDSGEFEYVTIKEIFCKKHKPAPPDTRTPGGHR